jgi:hypothetical protein
MNKELYYSEHCSYSLKILQTINQNFSNQFNTFSVDEYYLKYKDFPPNIRGTPTVLVEDNEKKINAYEGENIEQLLKELNTPSQQQPPQQTESYTSQIPIGGYQPQMQQQGQPQRQGSGFATANSTGKKFVKKQVDASTWGIDQNAKTMEPIKITKGNSDAKDEIEQRVAQLKSQREIPIVNGNS